MKRLFILGFSFAVVFGNPLTPTFAPSSAYSAEQAPKIAFSEVVHDFGEVEFGTKAEHVFKIKNEGNAPLMVLEVKKSCGCTMTDDIRNREVKPGEELDVKVGYDTTRKGPFDKQLTVMSNDPTQGTAFLRIKGNVRSEVEVNPMRVHFANVYRDETAQNVRKLTINSATLKDLKISEITSDNEHLETKFAFDPATNNWNVDVSLKPTAPLGNLNANLKVKTNSPKMPVVDVPVMAQVFGTVMLEPPRLFFGPKGPGEMQEGKITLTDRKNSGTFKILGMTDANDMLAMNVVTVKEGNQYTLEFKTKRAPENPGGYFNGNIEIKTNLPGEETITVPYNGYIQPAAQPDNK